MAIFLQLRRACQGLGGFSLGRQKSPPKQFAGLRIKLREPGGLVAVYSVQLIDVTAAEFVAVVPGLWKPSGQVAERASNLQLS